LFHVCLDYFNMA